MARKPRRARKASATLFPVPDPGMMDLALDSYRLWADSCAVIAMRTSAILTQSPGSEREAVRMVTEKWHAGIELAGKLAAAPHDPLKTSVDYLGPRVSANRKRLERKGRGK